MGEYNPEDLDGLSEEELAAIEDDENDTGGEDDQGDGDGDDGSSGDEDDPDTDDDAAAGEHADDDQGADDGSEDEGDDAEDGSDSEDDADEGVDQTDKETGAAESTDGQDDAGDASDAAQSVDDIYHDKIKALDERLDEGDIDFEAYKKELLSIDREHMRDIVREETARMSAENTWRDEQAAFFGENKYLQENPVVYGAFAGEVNRLLSDSKWASKPGPEVLAKAKESVDLAFKLGGAPRQKDKGDVLSKKQKAIQAAKKAGASRPTPKTLKDIPASDNNTDGAFDYLDKLEGAAYEAAVAKLSPEEMEAYAMA